jgi:hypothetical protein
MVITIIRKKGTPNELERWSLVRLVKIILTSEWIDKAAAPILELALSYPIRLCFNWIRALLKKSYNIV